VALERAPARPIPARSCAEGEAMTYSYIPLHDELKLDPGEFPTKVYTPNEMRKAISLAGRSSPWVRKAFHVADYTGLSGEDRYVLLAFHLLLEAERQTEKELKLLNASGSS
jgi:hypothetical protein